MALVSGAGSGRQAYTYSALVGSARRVQGLLQRALGRSDLRDVRVALLYPGGFDYAAALLGVWMAGGIAVPLHPTHPAPELEYLLADSGASVLLVASSGPLEAVARGLAKPAVPEAAKPNQFPLEIIAWEAADEVEDPVTVPGAGALAEATHTEPLDYGSTEEFLKRRALFIYTSGTTGKVSSQGNAVAFKPLLLRPLFLELRTTRTHRAPCFTPLTRCLLLAFSCVFSLCLVLVCSQRE